MAAAEVELLRSLSLPFPSTRTAGRIESLALSRQLRLLLGDSPQVLRDLKISLRLVQAACTAIGDTWKASAMQAEWAELV